MLSEMHREDIKAALRKKFGSVAAFERARSLPAKSVSDLLRGQKSARVEQAVVEAITDKVPQQSEGSDDSRKKGPPQRLNAGVR